ncbi:hypothetical protein MPSEU_000835000 [Mayamaea pseudoterrestris]|nr:hypothetical protein MPSEU_000835000 [Mayamaea pseudoterrestris]
MRLLMLVVLLKQADGFDLAGMCTMKPSRQAFASMRRSKSATLTAASTTSDNVPDPDDAKDDSNFLEQADMMTGFFVDNQGFLVKAATVKVRQDAVAYKARLGERETTSSIFSAFKGADEVLLHDEEKLKNIDEYTMPPAFNKPFIPRRVEERADRYSENKDDYAVPIVINGLPTWCQVKARANEAVGNDEKSSGNNDYAKPLVFDGSSISRQVKELMYFGEDLDLLMIHRNTGGRSIRKGDTRLRYIADYNRNEPPGKRDSLLYIILMSLYEEGLDHVLFDFCLFTDLHEIVHSGKEVMNWKPFYLDLVLRHVQYESDEAQWTSKSVVYILERFVTGVRDQWGPLFVLFLLARGLNGDDDGYFLPEDWFAKKPEVEFHPELGKFLDLKPNTKETWEDFKIALSASMSTDDPTIVIVYPESRRFGADAIIAYVENNKVLRSRGFQFYNGKMKMETNFWHGFEKLIGISGNPPVDDELYVDYLTCVAGEQAIRTFFGDAGETWSPLHWQRIYDSPYR